MPAATRWGSLHRCFKTLLASENIIFSIVNTRDFIEKLPTNQKENPQQIKESISSANFVKFLKKALFILQPIDDLFVEFQNDSLSVSDVYVGFLNLPEKLDCDQMLKKVEIMYVK